jgi:hypothetical protein
MTLPNAHLAVVEQEKVVAYLLNPTHPDNGGKATFFQMLGFELDNWLDLAAALRQLALGGKVAKTVESPHGNKYVVEGRIESPSGRSPMVLSVWIVDRGLKAPRLVTAYPREDRE